MSSRTVVAANLRAAIARSGMSIRQVVQVTGVSPAYMFKVLAAGNAPTIDWLERVGASLDVSVLDLMRPIKRTSRKVASR